MGVVPIPESNEELESNTLVINALQGDSSEEPLGES